jgi:hypothetical protein
MIAATDGLPATAEGDVARCAAAADGRRAPAASRTRGRAGTAGAAVDLVCFAELQASNSSNRGVASGRRRKLFMG